MKTYAIIQKLKQQKLNLVEPRIGDTVRIGIKITEAEKERVQYFQGIVICKHRSFNHVKITVRRVFQNIGIEKSFPINSLQIQSIVILKSSKPKRAKLFYLRNRIGKAANRVRKVK